MNITKIARSLATGVLALTYAGGLPAQFGNTWDTTTSSGPSFGFDHRGFFTECFPGHPFSNVTTTTSFIEGGFITQTGIALCTSRFPDGSVEEGLWDVEFVFGVTTQCFDPTEGDAFSKQIYSATCGQVVTGQAFIDGGVFYNPEESLGNGFPLLSLCADPESCRIDIFGPDNIEQCGTLFGGENTSLIFFEEFVNADNCGGEFPEGVQVEPGVKTAIYCHSADANPESGFFLSVCESDNPHTGSETVGHEGLEPAMRISPNSVQSNCGGDEGNVRATLFGSLSFDVSEVNTASVRLQGEAVEVKRNGQPRLRFRDVNNDGFVDVIYFFASCPRIAAFLAVAPRNLDGTVTLTLTGSLLDGTPIIAAAKVTPV